MSEEFRPRIRVQAWPDIDSMNTREPREFYSDPGVSVDEALETAQRYGDGSKTVYLVHVETNPGGPKSGWKELGVKRRALFYLKR